MVAKPSCSTWAPQATAIVRRSAAAILPSSAISRQFVHIGDDQRRSPRLQARPVTSFCINCKAEMEAEERREESVLQSGDSLS